MIGMYLELVMRPEGGFDQEFWFSPLPRRRFRIGDLMIVIAMTALALSAISLPESERW